MRTDKLRHKFVLAIPEKLDDGVLYISPEYRTVTHKCCCGGGYEVVTPLGPTDWKLTFDGISVSLYPSVGNWSLACRSHYLIECGTVRWARQWSDADVAAGRARDQALKTRYYSTAGADPGSQTKSEPKASVPGVWQRLRWWLTWS